MSDIRYDILDECDSCHFETGTHKFDPPFRGRQIMGVRKEPAKLCALCASTPAGNMLSYPGQYDHNAKALVKTICYVGNTILKALEAK